MFCSSTAVPPLGFLLSLQAFHDQCMPQTQHMVRVVDLIRPLCVYVFHAVEPFSWPPTPQSFIVSCLQDVLVFMSVNILHRVRSIYLVLHSGSGEILCYLGALFGV